jgi:hypothetical protein
MHAVLLRFVRTICAVAVTRPPTAGGFAGFVNNHLPLACT